MSDFSRDEQLVISAVLEARHIQEFIWDEQSLSRKPYSVQAWGAVFQKRVDAIAAINPDSPSAVVELRKRLLQQAALSIKALVVVANTERIANAGSRHNNSSGIDERSERPATRLKGGDRFPH